MTDIIRSDFFLTPEEYYRKRANIIEELKKCSIDMTYGSAQNSISTDAEEKKGTPPMYKINIQTPIDPCIPKKTAVYHELSHALWDSFVSGSIRILDDWSSETITRLLKERKIPATYSEMNKIPKHLTTEITEVQEKIRNYIKGVYHNCFNSLEDQRIESLTKNVWLATRGMFRKALTNCGTEMGTDSIKTPSDHLLAPRFFRPELTTPEYIKAVKDVEGTDMFGALVVMQSIRKLIDKHIEENLDNALDTMKKVIKSGCSLPIPTEIMNKFEEKQSARSSAVGNSKTFETRIDRYNNAIKNSAGLTPEQKKEARKRISKYRSIAKKAKEPSPKTEKESKMIQQQKKQQQQKETTRCIGSKTTTELEQENRKPYIRGQQFGSHDIGSSSILRPSPSYTNTQLKKALNTSLEQSKNNAKKEVNSILEKILVAGSPKEPAHIKIGVPRRHEAVTPDINVANILAKTFETVRHSKRTRLTESGSELDIEALIQTHNKGYGEYMLEEIRHKGLTIYVSIDGSGSMRYHNRMSEARTLVATMFKAVERVPSVKILANVWSSDDKGDVGITTVKSLSECKSIGLSETYFYTPTHESIRYTAKQMGNFSGKKLMIIITDGIPQYHKNNRQFSEEVLIRMAQKEYRRALRSCRNIMCINISGNNTRSRNNLQSIFKRSYVEFDGMNQAKQFVLKNFRRTVYETLRK